MGCRESCGHCVWTDRCNCTGFGGLEAGPALYIQKIQKITCDLQLRHRIASPHRQSASADNTAATKTTADLAPPDLEENERNLQNFCILIRLKSRSGIHAGRA